MNKDQVRTGSTQESGRVDEAMRNAEPRSREECDRSRTEQTGRSRADQDDILLHDDDEAELDLPR